MYSIYVFVLLFFSLFCYTERKIRFVFLGFVMSKVYHCRFMGMIYSFFSFDVKVSWNYVCELPEKYIYFLFTFPKFAKWLIYRWTSHYFRWRLFPKVDNHSESNLKNDRISWEWLFPIFLSWSEKLLFCIEVFCTFYFLLA